LDDAVTAFTRFRHQLAGLVGEIDQDGARFHQRNIGVAVDDRRDTVVWCDLEKVRCELFVFGNIDRMNGVGQTEFLEGDGSLAAVGGRPSIEINHGWCPWLTSELWERPRREGVGRRSLLAGGDHEAQCPRVCAGRQRNWCVW